MVMLLRLQDLGESHASQLGFLLTSLLKRPFAYKTKQNLHEGLILINNQTHHTNHPALNFILHSLRIKTNPITFLTHTSLPSFSSTLRS